MLNSVLQSLAHINNSYLNVALIQSEDSSVNIVNGLGGQCNSIPGRAGRHLFFIPNSKVILGPTQHPIQWTCEALSLW